jgi:hypothetical protein
MFYFQEFIMKLSKPLIALVGLVCLAAIAFVVYGLRTDCAHTAGYVDCSPPSTNPTKVN